MAYVNLVSSSETSLRCNVAGLDTTYNGAARTVYWYLDRKPHGEAKLANKVSSGGAYTFSDLTPGTRYYCSCIITIDSGAWSVDLGEYFSTDAVVIQKPDKWTWFGQNGPDYNATLAQTSNAYYAATGNGNVSNFSYLVWNDLCAKVMEVRNAGGFSWDNTYASYSSTLMSSSSKTLTATRMNSLRYNVNTALSTVSRGSIVYGYYLTQIATAVNNWIDYL